MPRPPSISFCSFYLMKAQCMSTLRHAPRDSSAPMWSFLLLSTGLQLTKPKTEKGEFLSTLHDLHRHRVRPAIVSSLRRPTVYFRCKATLLSRDVYIGRDLYFFATSRSHCSGTIIHHTAMNAFTHMDEHRSTTSCGANLRAHLIPLTGVNTATLPLPHHYSPV